MRPYGSSLEKYALAYEDYAGDTRHITVYAYSLDEAKRWVPYLVRLSVFNVRPAA